MQKWKAHVAQLFPIFIGFTLCFLALQLVFLWNFNSKLFLSAGIVSLLKIVSNLSIGWIMVSLIHLISSEYWHNWIRRVIFTLLYIGLIGTLICNHYVLVTHERLDEAIFLFEWNEVWMIADPTQRLNWLNTSGIVILLVLPFLLMNCLKRFDAPFAWLAGIIVLCHLIRFIPLRSDIDRISDNRFVYFIKRSAVALTKKSNYEKVNPRDFRDLDPAFFGEHQNIHPGYPLAHTLDEPSVLAENLRLTSHHKPPHIKIIIVESMSSDLFGERGKNTGILMPFLDSLSRKSLYFPNGFSTYQRTHNVLPAVLASVPNTIDGNVFQQLPFPKHYSLFNLLAKDYHTQFYCGVPLSYLNMVGLMSHYNTDYQISHWQAERVAHKDKVGSAWGFPDEDLFRQAHYDDSTKFRTLKDAVLKVFLTISSHDPFIYPNRDNWQRKVVEKSERISDVKLRKMVREQAASFGSFCYVDAVLQDFFSKEAQKPQFNNTIYIITGDHGTELYRRNALSKYNVPILVYSALLKNPKTSRAIVSHNDIAPTLINYLKSVYHLNLPDTVTFVGKELKISPKFKPDRKLVFTTNKLRTTDLISDQNAWVGGKLYSMNARLELNPREQPKLEKWSKKQLSHYQKFSRYTLLQNKFIDALSYSHWVGKPIVFKLSKAKHIKTLAVAPGMNFLESHHLKTKYSTIRIEVDCRTYLAKPSQLNDAPNLVVQSRKTRYLSKKWTVFKLVKPHIKGAFKVNGTNHLVYSLEFKPQDIAVWKNGGSMHYYFQHFGSSSPIDVTDVHIKVFHQQD